MRVIAFVFALLITLTCFSQKYSITIGTGLSQFKHDDLKSLQSLLEYQARPLGLKTIDNFPPYFYYSGEVSRKLGNVFSVGLVYRLESTGYKSSYSDYSGIIKFQQTLVLQEAGILVKYKFKELDKIVLSANLYTYLGWSDVDIDSYFNLYGSNSEYIESVSLESRSILINPEFCAGYPVTKQFSLHLTAGYCVDFKGKLNAKDSGRQLQFPDGTNVKTDWSGFRVGLSISIQF
jgi:hypothetical protein